MSDYIYILVDPRDNHVRYVGRTNTPHHRLTAHTDKSKRTNIEKDRWIEELRLLGLKPKMIIVDQTIRELIAGKERAWINRCRKAGCNLLNIS